jgi:topoisomerase-4 subunit A
MRLGSLKKLDEFSTKKEIKSLNIELNFLNKLINKNVFLDKFIVDELNQTSQEIDKIKILRRTRVNSKEIVKENLSFEEFQEVEKMTIIVTKNGFLKTYKDHIDPVKIQKDINDVFLYKKIFSNQKILLFVSTGRVYTIDPNILPTGKSNPKSYMLFVDSSSDEKLVGILPHENKLKSIVASKFGKGFIADLSEILTAQKKGKQLFNLKSGDQLIHVSNQVNSYIACVSKSAKLLIFQTNELPTLNRGGGVQLQKIKQGESLSDIQSFNSSDGITWKIGTLFRNEKSIDFWIGKRSQSGKKVPKRFNKNIKFYNE